MQRLAAGSSALVLLSLAACAGVTTPGETGSTIFEVEYVNFAWVPTWRGFAIDSTGAIHSYDLQGKPWEPANTDYASRAELLAKYAATPSPAGNVQPQVFETMRARAGAAAAGPFSEPRYRCADAGTVTYSAWLYDSEADAFRRVLLWREGDVAQLNQSTEGRALADWLTGLQLVPPISGCQPS